MLTDRIMRQSAENNFAIMLDGTGDKSFEHVKERVNILKSKGHRVVANYVTMKTELSLMINEIRYKKEGRRVPPNYVKDVNRDITNIVVEAIDKGLFDELHLYDTNIENKPRKILTFVDGELEIHNNDLYKVFLKKSEE